MVINPPSLSRIVFSHSTIFSWSMLTPSRIRWTNRPYAVVSTARVSYSCRRGEAVVRT